MVIRGSRILGVRSLARSDGACDTSGFVSAAVARDLDLRRTRPWTDAARSHRNELGPQVPSRLRREPRHPR